MKTESFAVETFYILGERAFLVCRRGDIIKKFMSFASGIEFKKNGEITNGMPVQLFTPTGMNIAVAGTVNGKPAFVRNAYFLSKDTFSRANSKTVIDYEKIRGIFTGRLFDNITEHINIIRG